MNKRNRGQKGSRSSQRQGIQPNAVCPEAKRDSLKPGSPVALNGEYHSKDFWNWQRDSKLCRDCTENPKDCMRCEIVWDAAVALNRKMV